MSVLKNENWKQFQSAVRNAYGDPEGIDDVHLPMTNREAIDVLQDFDKENFEDRSVGIYMDIEMKQAIPVAIQALLTMESKQPSNSTGLVPCGCGGTPHLTHKLWGEGKFEDPEWDVVCDKCRIVIEDFIDEDSARSGWNTAMGYRKDN
jgi:hypothetical protein